MKYQVYIFQKEKEEKFYRHAIDEYKKRLGSYCNISVKYLKKDKAWDKLAQSVGDRDLAFVLVPGRSELTSEGLAERIRSLENQAVKTLHFFIADWSSCQHVDLDLAAYGRETEVLHISDFDLPPAMTGMILFEQIYRAYRILNRQSYHK